MATCYFATKLTENISKTPEGFLICRNVPIARIGYQDYLADEIGAEGNGIVKVYRSPEEVFSAATVASAEGKDITDLHPSQWIDINNHAAYSKGHGQNTRKGTDEDSDFLLSDLFVKDSVLISKINGGQREVSCGYDCDYVKTENGYEQRNIRINHIAIVPNGRAGKQVAIRDSKISTKEKNKMSILAKMFAAFAKDASPEELEQGIEAISGKGEAKEVKKESKDAAILEALAKVTDGLAKVNDRLDSIEKKDDEKEDEDEKAMDALEKELEEASKGEAKDEAELITSEVLTGVELPTNPIPGADAALSLLRTMKPVIAAIADPAAKKKASDALQASVKGLMAPSTQQADYGKLLEAQRAKDAGAKTATAPEDLGKGIKEKFHRKPVAVR